MDHLVERLNNSFNRVYFGYFEAASASEHLLIMTGLELELDKRGITGEHIVTPATFREVCL
jgi:hypothetical protein